MVGLQVPSDGGAKNAIHVTIATSGNPITAPMVNRPCHESGNADCSTICNSASSKMLMDLSDERLPPAVRRNDPTDFVINRLAGLWNAYLGIQPRINLNDLHPADRWRLGPDRGQEYGRWAKQSGVRVFGRPREGLLGGGGCTSDNAHHRKKTWQ
jgi:hypothetical protein